MIWIPSPQDGATVTFSTPVVSLLSTYLDSDGLYPYKLVSFLPHLPGMYQETVTNGCYRNNTLVGTRHDKKKKVEMKVGIA